MKLLHLFLSIFTGIAVYFCTSLPFLVPLDAAGPAGAGGVLLVLCAAIISALVALILFASSPIVNIGTGLTMLLLSLTIVYMPVSGGYVSRSIIFDGMLQ